MIIQNCHLCLSCMKINNVNYLHKEYLHEAFEFFFLPFLFFFTFFFRFSSKNKFNYIMQEFFSLKSYFFSHNFHHPVFLFPVFFIDSIARRLLKWTNQSPYQFWNYWSEPTNHFINSGITEANQPITLSILGLLKWTNQSPYQFLNYWSEPTNHLINSGITEAKQPITLSILGLELSSNVIQEQRRI